ncbi:MAG: AAA family ATPase [Methanocorpusculum sp.]|nr:AAA family ATPase [Methanocorpusculum sp.]
MNSPLKKIIIEGYKSIKSTEIEFGDINIILGANSVGKSNIMSVIELIKSVYEGTLEKLIKESGGANAYFHYGTKNTARIKLQMIFADKKYELSIKSSADDSVEIEYETFSKISPRKLYPIVLYHFHDTGKYSPLKKSCDSGNCNYLYADGSNFPAVLYRIKNEAPDNFEKIIDTIRLVYPEFENFIFDISDGNISIRWSDSTVKNFEYPISAMSDGTLRFAAISTLMLQPSPPELIMIDEPELGLHPFAINVLSDLIHMASLNSQILISTQSIQLINNFEAFDILIAEYTNGGTVITRPNLEELEDWLKKYSIGEIWQRNVFGGNP